MRRFRIIAVAFPGVMGVFAGLAGCGAVQYTTALSDALEAVSRAEAEGAAETAPYHFRLSQEYLRKAETEAAGAHYGYAIRYAEAATAHAEVARAGGRRREPVP